MEREEQKCSSFFYVKTEQSAGKRETLLANEDLKLFLPKIDQKMSFHVKGIDFCL